MFSFEQLTLIKSEAEGFLSFAVVIFVTDVIKSIGKSWAKCTASLMMRALAFSRDDLTLRLQT